MLSGINIDRLWWGLPIKANTSDTSAQLCHSRRTQRCSKRAWRERHQITDPANTPGTKYSMKRRLIERAVTP